METTPIKPFNKAAQCLLFFLLTNLMLTSSANEKAKQQAKCSAMAAEIVLQNKDLCRDDLIRLLIKTFNATAARTEFLSGIDAAGYIDAAIRASHKK